MNPTQQMNAIANVEAMIVKDEALRYRMYHTAYILLLTSLGLMMGVGGIYLYLFPELELVGITLVFASNVNPTTDDGFFSTGFAAIVMDFREYADTSTAVETSDQGVSRKFPPRAVCGAKAMA